LPRTEEMMHIAIVGAGGVGGYFGGRLAAAGARVSFVARGTHLAALRTRGLTLKSPRGDVHIARVDATDDTAAIGHVDVVLYAVKLYDAEAPAATLGAVGGAWPVGIPFP